LIKKAVADGLTPIADAQRAWQERRHRDVAMLFHTLRGSFGTLGARRFAARALQLELTIHSGNRGEAETLFPVIAEDLQATLTAAKT
jgi:HPt (histidine-containing phosphotransfer) domain-containing protein